MSCSCCVTCNGLLLATKSRLIAQHGPRIKSGDTKSGKQPLYGRFAATTPHGGGYLLILQQPHKPHRIGVKAEAGAGFGAILVMSSRADAG